MRSHCTMLKENCELCTDLSIKLWVLWNYSSDQPCLCRIKKKKKKRNAWKMIEKPFSLINHTAFAPSPSANFFVISGLNSPSQRVPCPRNSRGDVQSCTVYTQCLNRGLYKKYLICLFLFASSLSLLVLWTIVKL